MKLKILTTLICFLCIGLVSVHAQEETQKEQKKIVIVKKTVDENGNETVEKIVKEGAEAEAHMVTMKCCAGKPECCDKIPDCCKDGEGKVKIRMNKNGETGGIWISKDNEVINLDGKKYEFNSDVSKNIKIVTKDDNGEESTIEWDGEGEMPAELLKQLEEKGIDIKKLDGGNGVFMIKTDGEGDHGELHEDHNFIFKTSKTNKNKAFLGVNIENIEDGGVKVVSIIEESAAADAGIQAGDIITSINDTKTSTIDELIDALTPFNPGDEVSVGLDRDGNATRVMAVLKERSDEQEEEVEKEIEVIVISDCNTNFSGDEDIDILFESIGDEDGIKEITKEIVIIKEDGEGEEREIEVTVETDGENTGEEIEVTVEVIDDETVVTTESVEKNENEFLDIDKLNNLKKLKLKEFKAFPNPTDGLLNLSFTGKKGPMLIQMTDVNGKQVYKKSVNDFDGQYNDQITFDGLAKGTYFLYIIQNGKVHIDNIVFN